MGTVDLYLIGGVSSGESIILHVPIANYTLVIDACKESDRAPNLTARKLKELAISEFDFIWTHPDKDHYLGICDLIEQFKINTLYWPCAKEFKKLAKHYLGMEVGDRLKQVLEVIDQQVASNALKVQDVTDNAQYRIKAKQYQFFLSTFAPSSQLAHQNLVKQKKKFQSVSDLGKTEQHSTIKSNDYSIGFVFEFDRLRICLSGDVEDKTLQYIDEDRVETIFSSLDYIKVPHHGSKTTQLHFSAMKRLQTAGMSRYRDAAPNSQIIQRYKDLTSEVYCTSGPTEDGLDYGIIHTRIPVKGVQKTAVHGRAYRC